jgi:hypothetical protein
MVAAKAGNYTLLVVDVIELQVAGIECLGLVYFQHYFLMILHFHLGVVVSQTAHLMQRYWLSLAVICLLESYINKRFVPIKLPFKLAILNKAEYSSQYSK